MKPKILLLNPFLTVYPDDPAGINPVLGLAYLAAYLEKKNYPVKIIDIAAEGAETKKKIGKKVRYGLTEKEIVKRVKQYDPQIIGITCQSTLHAKDAHETARIAKKACPEATVLMGGAHPSAVAEEVLRDKNIDLVVRGEGEITLFQVVENCSKSLDWGNIKGVSWRRGRKVTHNSPRPLIKNLDHLPFPARHLLPMEIYLREAQRSISYNFKKRVAVLISSRGCPGNCVYCAVRTIWGKAWRGRSAVNVVDEIESLVRDYQAEEIHFLDDSLSVDKKRLAEICEEIIRRKIKIKWATPNGIAIWLLDKDLLKKMKRAGCYRLTFGLESGNREVLRQFIGKKYDYAYARKIIEYASKLGFWTVGTFIIGFPSETREQIEDTINFAVSTDLDFATFYIANPFPGTPMYEIYRKEKLLPVTGAYDLVRGCRSKYFSHDDLIGFQAEATGSFLTSRLRKPWLVWRKLGNWENWLYSFRLGRNLFKLFVNRALVKERGIASLWR